MSNANKHSNTPASPTPPTPATPPAPPQAKPAIAAGDVKASVGNGTPATPGTPAPSPVPADGQAATSAGAPEAGAPETDAAGAAPDSESDPLMFFVVVGPLRQFKTAAKAEEYLNGPDAPADYTVIRGRVATTRRKISLRG